MIRVDPSPILFYFYLFIQPESIRVDPTRTGCPDFCTCLAKMFVCPVPKISQVMMKWRRRASHLARFTLWNNGRGRALHLRRFKYFVAQQTLSLTNRQ